MRLRRVLLPLLLVSVLEAQPKPGVLEGTVVNSATRAPVPKAAVSMASGPVSARITIPPSGDSFSRAGTTDENGKFRIANVEPGTYHVEYVRAPGYAYEPFRPLDIVVAEDQRVAGIALELLPLGTISGKVVDNDGEPLLGAQVAIMEYRYSNGSKSLRTVDGAVSDDRGEYRIFHLRPGRYFVNAWLPPGQIHNGVLQADWLPPNTHRDTPESGYLPVFYPNGADASQASRILVPPGGESGGINFQLRAVPVYHIRGKLTGLDAAGAGASVLASQCPEPDGAAEYGAKVQSGGRFDISGVTAGVYCLTLAQSGFSRTLYAGDTVTVADRNLESVALRGTAAFTVPGTLRFEGLSGDEPEAVVFLAPAARSGPGANNALVEEGGKFALEGSVPGSYSVRVNRLPPTMYLKSVQYGDQEIPDGVVTLRPGGAPLRLVVGTDAGQLSGSVQTESGDAAGSLPLTIVPAGQLASRADLLRWEQTDSAGHFNVNGLAPGDYQIYAWGDPNVPMAESAEFRQEFANRAAAATISGGAQTTVQLKVIPADEISAVKARF
jgi:carboxypeptidase family protein